MNHYDDLQRFKDKTRNQNHAFKDFSAQNLANDQGHWSLINQLSPATDASVLAPGGHVSVPVPQTVDPALFHVSDHEHANDAEPVEPLRVPASSIFQGVASQLDSVAPAFNAAASAPEPARFAPVMQIPAPHPASLTTAASARVNYAKLFAAKTPEAKPAPGKNQPLQSLLERIASCR
ncbi:cellulose biosynthesis protein BcsO [Kosakonia sp. BK9b]|uniref:cellulose biosynthesis protein BcsO n=1 Tax=Kosakonia sp. TaxID=1916651 RepID=UPI0028A15A4A|nr:cellulose biosynthesis protein BcsO [Kosakonia sp.]